MKITNLSLTNFRSFKETQTINFAPVTLLFGPNSVGKSTVLMALFYLQQILEKGQCDPQRIDALGNKFIGGFKNLVHGRNISSRIKIRVDYEMNGTLGSNYYDYTSKLDFSDELAVDTNIISKGKRAIEVEVSWSKVTQTAYVSKTSYWINGEFIGELVSDEGQTETYLSRVNYLHKALIPRNHDEWLVSQFENGEPIHGENYAQALFEARDIEIPSDRDISKGADNPLDDYDEPLPEEDNSSYVSYLHELLLIESGGECFQVDVGHTTLLNAPLRFNSWSGSLPNLNRDLKIFLDLDNDHSNRIIGEIFSDVFVTPLNDLYQLLNDSLCIGPLREIPDDNFQSNPYPEIGDWYSGKAAWDTLAKADRGVLNRVHAWIASESKLGLGYGLSINVTKAYTESKLTSTTLQIGQIEEQLSNMISNSFSEDVAHTALFDQMSTKVSYSLFDLCNHISVTPSDIGVGVSQLLPLVVAAVTTNKGFVSCEQPELHVHPRVQVGIGDLLTQANDKANFLIETHSEHLILRILRRIRETTDNELAEGMNPVKPEDVSIVYIESSDNGVVVKNIEIDEEGEFKTRWPQGFFSERREEYM